MFLLHSALVVNEVVDLARKKKMECLIMKVDFQKAYDSISWRLLHYMLRWFGFSDRWCGWMKTCVFFFFYSFSALVNGCLAIQMNIKKDLKHEDPLAHF